jgi:hypothetical protein
MKRVAVGFVGMLFLLASALGFASVFAASPQIAHANTPEEPGSLQEMWDQVGVRAHCWDSRDGQSDMQHATNNMHAYYNTTGFLAFSFRNMASEDRISDIDIDVVRLGAPATDNWVGDNDLSIESGWFPDERDRDFAFRWNYRAPTVAHRAVGVFRITIFIEQDEVDHDPLASANCEPEEHEHDEDCDYGVGCEKEWDFSCAICEHRFDLPDDCECNMCGGLRVYTFDVICRSSAAEFGASIRFGNNVYTESERFAARTNFEVRARSLEDTLYWNSAAATYIVHEDCEVLKVDESGLFMVLNAPTPGEHTLKFTVIFDFVHVSDTGVVTIERGKEVDIELKVTFFNRPRPVQWWEILIGVAVVGALGGTAWLINKLSKNIELQQK